MPAPHDWRWESDVRYKVAWFEHCFPVRAAAWQKMKITDGDRSCTLGSLHMDRRLQCNHRHTHVRGVGRDAMFAGAKHGKHAVAASDGRAARAGLALVARHRGVAEVHASCSLKQVARSRRHIAKLCRCAGENRLRENGIISLHHWMVGEI